MTMMFLTKSGRTYFSKLIFKSTDCFSAKKRIKSSRNYQFVLDFMLTKNESVYISSPFILSLKPLSQFLY